jgi:DNA polymerase III subunit alpha
MTKRFKFDSDQFFVKSADEMARIFPNSPAVLERTMEIAERCNLKLNQSTIPSRILRFPPATPSNSYFEHVCREGMKKRLETAVRQLELRGVRRSTPEEYEARLKLRDRHHQADEVSGLLS